MSKNQRSTGGAGVRDSLFRRAFVLFLTLGLTLCLGWLSFGWSLQQTIDFTALSFPEVVGGLPMAIVLGIIIQFWPQVALFLADEYDGPSDTEKKWRVIWLATFWITTGLDIITNLGARANTISMDDPSRANITYPAFANLVRIASYGFGFAVDIGVAFAEEAIGHTLSAVSQNIAYIMEHMDIRPPAWMYIFSIASGKGGGYQVNHTNGKNQAGGHQGKQSGNTPKVSARKPRQAQPRKPLTPPDIFDDYRGSK